MVLVVCCLLASRLIRSALVLFVFVGVRLVFGVSFLLVLFGCFLLGFSLAFPAALVDILLYFFGLGGHMLVCLCSV